MANDYYNQMYPGSTSEVTGYGSSTPNLGASSPDNGGFNFGGAMLGSGIGGALGGLFGNNKNPADAANQYLNQMPGAIAPYMQPYMTAGGNALGSLQDQYGNLLSHPGDMMNQIGSNFHQSPGFQFALSQALRSANQASAAGGMAGSPQAQQQNMQTATQMGNQDYYNWMNNAMGLYGQGLQGEQGLAGMGMQAGTNMANTIAAQMQQQAANAYASQQAQNQSNSGMFSDLGAIAGGLAHFLPI